MANARRVGTRMGKQWLGIPSITLNMTANGTNLGARTQSTTSQTVLRMIGEYNCTFTPEGAVADGDECRIGLAIGIVSSDAFEAGITAVPDPVGEPEYPWLFWAEHSFAALEATDIQRSAEVGNLRRSFDIRSMRKMKPRESLVWVVQYVDSVGTPPYTVQISATRVLIGLH